jgi:hypothetical protein
MNPVMPEGRLGCEGDELSIFSPILMSVVSIAQEIYIKYPRLDEMPSPNLGDFGFETFGFQLIPGVNPT